MFHKYTHLERFGTSTVEGIEHGEVYVFPKLDGTNASIWSEGFQVKAGSRNRVLDVHNDNAGFCNWLQGNTEEAIALREFAIYHPRYTLFGEWLVPHSLKTYREDAWRKFYLFDVYDHVEDRYLHYNEYKEMMEGVANVIHPMAIIRNGSYEHFQKCTERNTYLIQEGKGVGEGVVLKNYDFVNRFGYRAFAKIVTNHFKELNLDAFGPPQINGDLIEDKIVEEIVTPHLVHKTKAKIEVENDGWQSRFIPQLLGRVWYDVVTEELFNVLKKHKNPTINFARLNRLTIEKIKRELPEVF